MKVIKEVSRRELIEFYLKREAEDGKSTPSSVDSLDWDNPNTLDAWLDENGYKEGVISGFKKWKLVKLSKDDLLDCAIVGSIFPGKSQCVGSLLEEGVLENWKPDRVTTWFNWLESGKPFKKEWALILRPALPCEKACWYIEDGSGRALCYTRRINKSGEESRAFAFIGHSPDPSSNWLKTHLGDGYFLQQFRELECSN